MVAERARQREEAQRKRKAEMLRLQRKKEEEENWDKVMQNVKVTKVDNFDQYLRPDEKQKYLDLKKDIAINAALDNYEHPGQELETIANQKNLKRMNSGSRARAVVYDNVFDMDTNEFVDEYLLNGQYEYPNDSVNAMDMNLFVVYLVGVLIVTFLLFCICAIIGGFIGYFTKIHGKTRRPGAIVRVDGLCCQ